MAGRTLTSLRDAEKLVCVFLSSTPHREDALLTMFPPKATKTLSCFPNPASKVKEYHSSIQLDDETPALCIIKI